VTRLTRSAACLGAAPPVRIAHIGLGAFHRSHQAWFTAHAAPDWGIASFTGRTAAAALPLAEQDGLFTLVERGAEADRAEIVTSISSARDGADTESLTRVISSAQTTVVTLTITEGAYAPSAAALAQDRRALAAKDPFAAPPVTALGRLALALEARRRADAGPIAIVPCDNLPGNGRVVRDALLALAADNTAFTEYIEDFAPAVSTSVDRITPAVTEADLAEAERLTGFEDYAAVVAEPFRDWTLAGRFPAARPAWEDAGARFVDDIEPYEHRKLWLLNGAHTILAAAGTLRGHRTVASAMADDVVRGSVEAFWDEAARHLSPGLGAAAYRDALVSRFLNPRIVHRLDQISRDSAIKVRARIVPVLLRERGAGRDAAGCIAALAAWVDSVAPGEATARVLVRASERLVEVAPDVDSLRRFARTP